MGPLRARHGHLCQWGYTAACVSLRSLPEMLESVFLHTITSDFTRRCSSSAP